MQGGKGDLVVAPSPNVERLLINFADPNTDEGGAKAEPDTKHPFFSDLNVRKAFAMAVDRKSIADQLYGPAGQSTCNMITSPAALVSKNTDSMDVCKYDIAAANALLDQAGWAKGSDGIRQKDGVRMHVVFQTTVNPLRQKEQAIVKSGLGAARRRRRAEVGRRGGVLLQRRRQSGHRGPLLHRRRDVHQRRHVARHDPVHGAVDDGPDRVQSQQLARQQLPPLVQSPTTTRCTTSCRPRRTRPNAPT